MQLMNIALLSLHINEYSPSIKEWNKGCNLRVVRCLEGVASCLNIRRVVAIVAFNENSLIKERY